MLLLLQNTKAAVILTDVSYHKWFFKWTNLSPETARFQLGHVCLPLQQILSWCLKQESTRSESEHFSDCHCKPKSVSTHSMQNNPTLLQRSESAVTTQHPFPLTGLVPSGQMWTEDAILSSSPLTPRVTAGTTKTHTEKARHTPGRWDRRKQLNRYVQQCCFLFFHSSTLPRTRPRTAPVPWAHYTQAHPFTTNNSGALITYSLTQDLPLLGLPWSPSSR